MPYPEDLLQPSLNASDDLKGFNSPWNPQSLVFAAFFAGPFAGGFLMALNSRRLGMHRWFTKHLLIFVGLGIAIYAAWILLALNGAIDKDDKDSLWLCRFIPRVVTVVAAYWIALKQKERFRLFTFSGGAPAGALVPGIAAVIAGLALNYVILRIASFVIIFFSESS